MTRATIPKAQMCRLNLDEIRADVIRQVDETVRAALKGTVLPGRKMMPPERGKKVRSPLNQYEFSMPNGKMGGLLLRIFRCGKGNVIELRIDTPGRLRLRDYLNAEDPTAAIGSTTARITTIPLDASRQA